MNSLPLTTRMVFWIADPGADPFQGLQDIFATIGESGIGGRTQPGQGMDDGQDAELFAHGELVVDKIHCPDLVRPRGLLASSRSFASTRRFGCVLAAVLSVVLWNLWVYGQFEGKPRVAVYFLVVLLVGLLASRPFAAIKFHLDKLRFPPGGVGGHAG